MISVLHMKELRLREVKWFEHSQDLNPGLPKAYIIVSILGGGVREEKVGHEVLESHHVLLKALCPKCHPASFLMMGTIVRG